MKNKMLFALFGVALLLSDYCYSSNESMDAIDIEKVAEGPELNAFISRLKAGYVETARSLIKGETDHATRSIMQGELYLVTDNVEALCHHNYHSRVARYYHYACQVQNGICDDMHGINENSYLFRTNQLLKAVSQAKGDSSIYDLIDTSDVDYGDKVFTLARFLGYEKASEYCGKNNQKIFECEFVRIAQAGSIRMNDLNLNAGYDYSQALYVILLAIEYGSPDLHKLMSYFGMMPSCSADYYLCNLIKANASIYQRDESSFEVNMARAESLWLDNDENLVLRLNAYVQFCNRNKLKSTLAAWKASEKEYEYWLGAFDNTCR